jgi:hypothetical protein
MKDLPGNNTFQRQVTKVMENAQEAAFNLDQLITTNNGQDKYLWGETCFQLDVIFETWRGLSGHQGKLLTFNDHSIVDSLLRIEHYICDIHRFLRLDGPRMKSKPVREFRLIYYEVMKICDQLEQYFPAA